MLRDALSPLHSISEQSVEWNLRLSSETGSVRENSDISRMRISTIKTQESPLAQGFSNRNVTCATQKGSSRKFSEIFRITID